MPLDTAQVTWINTYAGLSPALVPPPELDGEGKPKRQATPDPLPAKRAEFERTRIAEENAAQDLQATMLTKATDAVFGYKDVLRAAFDFQMGSKKNLEVMRDDKTGDQEKEVGGENIRKRAKKGEKISTYDKDGKENIALLSKATNAMDVVVKEKKRLTLAMRKRSTFNDKDGTIKTEMVALFTSNEIAELYYTPLVRARLIPDGVINNDFSATQRMLDATSMLYVDGELKNAKDPKSNVDEIGATIAGIGGSIATAITGAFGVDTQLTKGMIEAGVALVSLGVQASTLALGVEDKDVKDLCAKVPDIVGSIVGAATGNAEIARAIKSGGAVAVRIGAAGADKLKGKKVGAADIGNLVKDCLLEVLKQASTFDSKNDTLVEACNLLTAAAKNIDLTKAQGVAAGLQKGDWKIVSSGIFAMLSDFAANAPALTGDVFALEGKTMDKALTDALKDGGDALSGALTLVSDVVSAKDADAIADKLFDGIPQIVGKVVSAATGDAQAGKLVAAYGGQLGQAAKLVKTAANGGTVTPDAVAKLVSAAIGDIFGALEKKYGDNATTATALTQTQAAVDKILSNAGEWATIVGKGSASDKNKAAGKILLTLLGLVGSAVGDNTNSSVSDAITKAQGVLDKAVQAGKAAQAELEKAKTEVEAIRKELAEKHDADAEAEADELVDKLEQERLEYQKNLKAAMQPGADQKIIMKMIAEMKRDQAIMNVAISLGSAGLEVAAQFFAPLAIGAQLLKMIAHMGAAVQRALDLKKMLDAQEWAQSAVSVYQSSINNFLKNQQEQLAEHSIKAAMCALRIASEIAATAYPAAKAVSAGVSIAQASVDVGFSIYKESEMRSAWMTTREALEDLDDRKLGLKARRLNPTLAKYSIAYGALTEKDPVAVKTMNEVGLTNEMLQSEEAGVALVKTFLETRFSEDAKVAFKWDPTAAWVKKLPPPALDAPNMFGAFKAVGTEGAKFAPGKVPAAPPNAMVGALNKFQAELEKQAAAKKETEKLREAGKKPDAPVGAVTALRDALVTETKAGQEARRLANAFIKESTKLVATITALKSEQGDPKAFKAFVMASADIVVAYRTLAQDELGMLESDLLTPMVELTRAETRLKTFSG